MGVRQLCLRRIGVRGQKSLKTAAMWHVSPVAVCQPCELLYTCYLLTYLHGERERITGVWRRSPSGVQGQSRDRPPYTSPCKNSSDLYQFQERPLAKVGVDTSTPVHSVATPLGLDHPMNRLPISPSIRCQRHHFWHPAIVFVARLIDGSRAYTPQLCRSAGMHGVPHDRSRGGLNYSRKQSRSIYLF